jgi:hypothetical protein
MICERCKNDIHKYDICNYCNRKICFNCVKSQKKINATDRAYICKDCWSNMKRRKKYKSFMVVKAVDTYQQDRGGPPRRY